MSKPIKVSNPNADPNCYYVIGYYEVLPGSTMENLKIAKHVRYIGNWHVAKDFFNGRLNHFVKALKRIYQPQSTKYYVDTSDIYGPTWKSNGYELSLGSYLYKWRDCHSYPDFKWNYGYSELRPEIKICKHEKEYQWYYHHDGRNSYEYCNKDEWWWGDGPAVKTFKFYFSVSGVYVNDWDMERRDAKYSRHGSKHKPYHLGFNKIENSF